MWYFEWNFVLIENAQNLFEGDRSFSKYAVRHDAHTVILQLYYGRIWCNTGEHLRLMYCNTCRVQSLNCMQTHADGTRCFQQRHKFDCYFWLTERCRSVCTYKATVNFWRNSYKLLGTWLRGAFSAHMNSLSVVKNMLVIPMTCPPLSDGSNRRSCHDHPMNALPEPTFGDIRALISRPSRDQCVKRFIQGRHFVAASMLVLNIALF